MVKMPYEWDDFVRIQTPGTGRAVCKVSLLACPEALSAGLLLIPGNATLPSSPRILTDVSPSPQLVTSSCAMTTASPVTCAVTEWSTVH